MHKWNGPSEFPVVITIFSAPNYCDVYNNKGAIIKFEVNNNYLVYLMILFRVIHWTFSNLITPLTPIFYPTSWIYLPGPFHLWQKKLWKCCFMFLNKAMTLLITTIRMPYNKKKTKSAKRKKVSFHKILYWQMYMEQE